MKPKVFNIVLFFQEYHRLFSDVANRYKLIVLMRLSDIYLFVAFLLFVFFPLFTFFFFGSLDSRLFLVFSFVLYIA